jgi:UPF0716 family protein affecting phage T7 exclusion
MTNWFVIVGASLGGLWVLEVVIATASYLALRRAGTTTRDGEAPY